MTFYLGKVLWFFAQPSHVLVLGICIGFVFIWRGRVAAGLRVAAVCLAALVVVGMSALGDVLIAPLERRFERPDLAGRSIAGIIVLGGAEDSNGGPRELMGLNEAAERMTEGAALAHRLPHAKLIFSGGSAHIFRAPSVGAEQSHGLFSALGIAADRIMLEDKSRTTFENAVYTREALKVVAGQRYLLVTSAWHMPRAMGCFRAAGFDVLPWPVDYRAPLWLKLFSINSSLTDGLRRVDFVAREYLGLLTYRLTGRTTALFPGP